MDLLRNYDIAVPIYKVATDPQEALEIAEEKLLKNLVCAACTDHISWEYCLVK